MNILHVNVAIQVSKSKRRYVTALVCGSLPQVMNDDDMLCRCDNYDPSTYCKYCAEAELDFCISPVFKYLVAMNIRNEEQYYCNAILAEELVVQWLQVHALAAHSGSRFDFHRIEFRCLASLSYSTLMAMLHGKSYPRR